MSDGGRNWRLGYYRKHFKCHVAFQNNTMKLTFLYPPESICMVNLVMIFGEVCMQGAECQCCA